MGASAPKEMGASAPTEIGASAPKEKPPMFALRRGRHDPWWDDGVGARGARSRRRVVGFTALAIAIVACGMTLAAWVTALFPSAVRLLG